MLHLTRNLNRRFDTAVARARLTDLGIPLNKKTGKLSGGQQAQLALTMALARRPRLLILDEPLSALDPLARQDFLATVMTAMADDGVSVLLSSHALAELERVADYLIVLGARPSCGSPGEVDDLLAGAPAADRPGRRGRRVRRPADRGAGPARRRAGAPAGQDRRAGRPVPPGWESHPVSLEEVVMAYLRSPRRQRTRRPVTARVQRPQPTEATR